MLSLRHAALTLALAASTLPLAPSEAAARYPRPRMPDLKTHRHEGFFFRIAAGLGYNTLSVTDVFDDEIGIGGFGTGGQLAFGGAISENVILYADFYGTSVFSPSVSFNGEDLGSVDAELRSFALGLGVAYYFMPVNIFISGSFGVGDVTAIEDGQAFESKLGPALALMVGKEWWVGKEWGIGVAGRFTWNSLPTESSSSDASFTTFNVLFTATYN